ncbi:MAG: RNA-binding protein, partial [Chloroflexota bacterium]
YRQPLGLFHNNGNSQFTDAQSALGDVSQKLLVGRGLAIGDLNNDGAVDVVVTDLEGAPVVLLNQATPGRHWLLVRLVGRRSPRDGQGAVLQAVAGGRKLTRLCTTGGSFASASDSRIHFGLGANRTVERLEIRWPSGVKQTLHDIVADQILTVREP